MGRAIRETTSVGLLLREGRAMSLGSALHLLFSLGPGLHSGATSSGVAFSFMLLPAPIMWLLLPLEIPSIPVSQCCTVTLYNRSLQTQWPLTRGIYGPGRQLSEAQLIYTEAPLGGSAPGAGWIGVCPTCVRSGLQPQKLRGSFSH